MVKTILSLITLTAFSLGATAQNVNIPDANFKAYLVGVPAIDVNSDTEIQVSEAASYTGALDCSYKGIGDLTGIEAFTSMTSFKFEENYLTTLDLSQNTALTTISCYYSYSLTSLILGPNTALTLVDLSYSPTIVNLNFSQSVNLETLALEISPSLTNLDVSQNAALKNLYVRDCNFSTIDVSNNTLLERFKCEGNNLSSLDVTKNTALKWFSCSENNLSILDVSRNTAMTTFQCMDNDLTILNMKNLSTTTLGSVAAVNNPNLTCIDVDDVAAASAAWTYIDPASSFNLNCQIDMVNSINVYGQSGNNVIYTPGGTLQMYADIMPTYADDATYTWSVTNGTGTATIDANGLLTAMTDGNVTVTATANDASGVTGTTSITIANQSIGVNEQLANQNISIYPNPVKSQLTISAEERIESIVIMDLTGKIIKTIVNPINTVDVSNLTNGVYFLQLKMANGLVSKKFIKE